MRNCYERVKPSEYVCRDGVFDEQFTFLGNGIPKSGAECEEKADRICRTRGHSNAFPSFANFCSEFQDTLKGARHRLGREQIRSVRTRLASQRRWETPKGHRRTNTIPRKAPRSLRQNDVSRLR